MPNTNEVSQAHTECAIEQGNLVSDAAFAAEAKWYPLSRICSTNSCNLLGKDLLINRTDTTVTVSVRPECRDKAAPGCRLESVQQRGR